jgi:hypothetical protein
MDAKEYRAKARAYVAKEGRKTPTEIYKAIGQPPTGYRLKADGKGSVTTESTTNRRGRKTRAESKRQEALRLRPPQTKEEENLRRRQNYKRTGIRQKGGSVVIDHKIDLSLLQSTVEGLPPEQAKARIEQLEKSYGPLGDRPQNRQIIGEYTNELKRQQTKAVQSKLRSMEAKRPSRANLKTSKGSIGLSFRDVIDTSTMISDTGFSLPGDDNPFGGRTVDVDPLFTGMQIRLP